MGCQLTKEKDPLGIHQHEPGAKLDAGKNRLGLIMGGFPRALTAIGRVGTYGANKYTPNGWKSVPDGVERYTDAMYRHLMSEACGEMCDTDTGILHAAHAAWNALARLELMLRAMDPAPAPVACDPDAFTFDRIKDNAETLYRMESCYDKLP